MLLLQKKNISIKNKSLTILLNNIKTPIEKFSVNNGLNYGDFLNHKTLDYEMHFTKNEIIKLIEKEYNDIRDEIKTDDEVYKDISDFTNTNYCSLSELLFYETDFEEIIKTYLQLTLFNKIFFNTSKNQYVINSTDLIIIKESTVIFKGKVFNKILK